MRKRLFKVAAARGQVLDKWVWLDLSASEVEGAGRELGRPRKGCGERKGGRLIWRGLRGRERRGGLAPGCLLFTGM